jgi:LysM repeat protein
MYKLVITSLMFVISFTATAQRVSVEEYIEQFKDIAISEMKRSGVPASITLAQGILESENGNSDLVKRSNNHFGIKCKSTWSGESVTHDDDATGECFRAYSNADESYRDHSDFLKANKRYASLFSLDPADYAGWAKGLKKAGYATNPRYPEMLIKHIEQYNLQLYSLAALNGLPGSDLANTTADGNTNPPENIANEKAGGPQAVPEIIAEPGELSSINNTKCIFVKKGTSLLAVARSNNIPLHKLMQFNDKMEEGLLAADQYIYLQKKPRTGEKEFYFAQPGETVHEAAQNAGVQLSFLLAYNQLSAGTTFHSATRLWLQPVAHPAKAGNKESKVHLVAPKEGLYSIARTYKVSVKQLKEWNKLDSDHLQVGQPIIVSK